MIKLNNGIDIPVLGLGVFRNPSGESTRNAVWTALKNGYRHIDTARIYGNEEDVGTAIRHCGLERSEVFVTTKLWNSDQGYQGTINAFQESLHRLHLDYVDLYLMHWPVEGLRLESWRAMEKILAGGKVRAIGVSNFMTHHLKELLDHCEVIPAVNQIEMSPYLYLTRQEILEMCRERGIVVEAYSPLTKGRKLDDPDLVRIAGKYGKTTAQVLIRWAIDHGFVVLPKSARSLRIIENGAVFDFTLSKEDMTFLDGLDGNLVTGWDPAQAK